MENPSASEHKSDLERLREMEDQRVKRIISQELLTQQFAAQNRILKWALGVLTPIIGLACLALFNDHFMLRATADKVHEISTKLDPLVQRNMHMWYDGKYHEKYPSLNP